MDPETEKALGVTWRSRTPLEPMPSYIAVCCREWIAPMNGMHGRCGICGEVPVYLRPDPESPR